jgi:sec-independent protein translocase protein TatA
MLSISQIIIVLIVILVLFGAGKLPSVMGDLGKGIKSFRKNIKDGDKDGKKIENSETEDK